MTRMLIFLGLLSALSACTTAGISSNGSTPAVQGSVQSAVTGISGGSFNLNVGPGLQPSPEIVTKICSPPSMLMAESSTLPALNEQKTYSLSDVMRTALNDTRAYQRLRLIHDTLVEWVRSYCQK